MRYILIVILFLLFCSPAQAVTYCKRFPTDTAVACYGPDYPPPSSGNVGIGTTGRIPVYIGTTTIGSPYNIFANSSGNVGIGTSSPGSSLSVLGGASFGSYATSAAPAGGIIVSGNVGIGTTSTLDYLTVRPINNGGLTVDALGTANGIDANNLLMLHLNNNVVDSETAGTPKTVTNSNVTFSNSNPFFTGSYYGVFNGTNAILTVGSNSDVPSGTSNFTIDFKANFTNFTNRSAFFYRGTNANNRNMLWVLNSGTTVVFDSIVSGVSAIAVQWTVSLSAGIKYQIALQRSSTSTWNLFINGVSQGAPTLTSGSLSASLSAQTGNIIIGEEVDDAQYFIGNFAEYRYSNIARYASDFTPQTVPYSAATSTPVITFKGSSTQTGFIMTDGNDSNKLKLGQGMNTSVAIDSNENVGIGTLFPGDTLSVGGNAAIGTAYSTVAAPSNGLLVQGNTGIGTINPQNILSVGAGAAIGATYSTLTAPSNGLIVQGNVGIGTNVPASLLHLSKAVASGSNNLMLTLQNTQTSANDNRAGMFLQTANSASEGVSIQARNNGASSGDLMISTVNGGTSTERMRVTGTGFVGIGTTAPQTGFVSMGNVGIGTWTAAGGNLIINGGGSVGISTAFPSNTLDVNGTISASNSGNTFFGGNVGIGTAAPPINSLSVQGQVAIGSAAYAGTTAPSNGLIVSGNVGIGTLIPASKLTIGTSQLMQKVTTINTACNTVCGQMGCWLGEDTGVLGTLVDCADATADVCFCSK